MSCSYGEQAYASNSVGQDFEEQLLSKRKIMKNKPITKWLTMGTQESYIMKDFGMRFSLLIIIGL